MAQQEDCEQMIRPIDDIMDEGDGDEDDEEFQRTSKSRTSSKDGKKIAVRRFDIKQLKAEIWKILESRLPSYYRT